MKNVYAHYFTWFANTAITGRWEHWGWDNADGICHNPDRIIDGLEDVAAVDIPLIGAYDSGSRAVHEYHLDLALSAGIDAFCVDWYGVCNEASSSRNDLVSMNFEAMLDSAATHAVKLCVCYEEKILSCYKTTEQQINAGKNHMKYIVSRLFPSKGYWQVEGRPVLIIWGNNKLQKEIWDEILSELEPYKPWILYSHHDHNPEYTSICDGFYPWVLIGDLEFQRKYLDEYYSLVKKYLESGKSKTFCGGVWPGFDDSGVCGWGSGTRSIHDKKDELHSLTWRCAIDNNPEWVSITTWNDWNEGTNIEPGVRKGLKYIKETAAFISAYKGSNSILRIEEVLEKHRSILKHYPMHI